MRISSLDDSLMFYTDFWNDSLLLEENSGVNFMKTAWYELFDDQKRKIA